MSNRQKTPATRHRCERCGRRNQRLQSQTLTGINREGQPGAVTAVLCSVCTQAILSKMEPDYDPATNTVTLPPVPEPSRRKVKDQPPARK